MQDATAAERGGKPLDHIVVDVEIQKSVDDLPGKWEDTHLMGVACAVVYEFATDRYHVYLEGDVAMCLIVAVLWPIATAYALVTPPYPWTRLR